MKLKKIAQAVGEALFDRLTIHMHRMGLLLAADPIPNAADMARYRVTNPDQSEMVRQRLYDAQLYPTAGSTQFSFFALPIGQGITSAPGATVGQAKTIFDTNLQIASTLPSGKAFLIESIEILFQPGTVAIANTFTMSIPSVFAVAAAAAIAGQINDVVSFYQSGLLTLNVLDKPYLQEYVQAFPPKTYFEAVSAIATNSATVGELALVAGSWRGRPYIMEPPIALQPAVNFSVTITYPGAVATPSGFNGRVAVILDGYFYRASQ